MGKIGKMGQMTSFMSNSMPSAMSMGSPMSHLSGEQKWMFRIGVKLAINFGANGVTCPTLKYIFNMQNVNDSILIKFVFLLIIPTKN